VAQGRQDGGEGDGMKKMYRGWALVSDKGMVSSLYEATKRADAIEDCDWFNKCRRSSGHKPNWHVIPFSFDPVPKVAGRKVAQ